MKNLFVSVVWIIIFLWNTINNLFMFFFLWNLKLSKDGQFLFLPGVLGKHILSKKFQKKSFLKKFVQGFLILKLFCDVRLNEFYFNFFLKTPKRITFLNPEKYTKFYVIHFPNLQKKGKIRFFLGFYYRKLWEIS